MCYEYVKLEGQEIRVWREGPILRKIFGTFSFVIKSYKIVFPVREALKNL